MLLAQRGHFKNKRIGLMVRSFEGGGAERVMVTLANRFVELGHSVDYIVIKNVGPYKKELSPKVKLIALGGGGKDLKSILSIVRKLFTYFYNTPPIVMLSTPKLTNLFAIFVKLISFCRSPLIIREASTLDWTSSKHGMKDIFIFLAMRLLYPYSTRVIANSNATKLDLTKYLKLSSKKIHMIYNPVNLNKFFINHEAKHDSTVKTIVGCGSLYKYKNFVDLIAAFPSILAKYPEAQLIILGEGPERVRLQEQIDNLRITNSVHLLGFVENPYQYFILADVFAHTSLSEGFGYVLAEAMACGTPVVAYDSHGAVREILCDGKYGTLVKVGDIPSLSGAIMQQIENPISEELLHEAVARFDVRTIAEQYLRIMFLRD